MSTNEATREQLSIELCSFLIRGDQCDDRLPGEVGIGKRGIWVKMCIMRIWKCGGDYILGRRCITSAQDRKWPLSLSTCPVFLGHEAAKDFARICK